MILDMIDKVLNNKRNPKPRIAAVQGYLVVALDWARGNLVLKICSMVDLVLTEEIRLVVRAGLANIVFEGSILSPL
jgi:hypothetical protein